MSEKIIFTRKLHRAGGSLVMTIPIELQEFLEVEDGDEVGVCADSSKHGKFLGIWNIKKQEKEAKTK